MTRSSNRCALPSTHRWLISILLLLLGAALLGKAHGDEFQQARLRMVAEAVQAAGVTDERVLDAMRRTPRHAFVAPSLRDQAYFDMALPIGFQQTISSPFIVAYMTQCLDPQPSDKVLEIGTGSGYQAAVLSPLVRQVFSIEIVEPLGNRAARTLARLDYKNVTTKVGDGFLGWPEHAPFDKIIVTCSPEKVPQPLVDQLREGGLMVIPTGERYQQTLYLMRKRNGRLAAEALRPTLFVPMTGAAEENRQVQPDPARPQTVNGSFEERPGENGFVPGWYYQRQLEWVPDASAPDGRHFVRFTNAQAGRSAHLLQGFPVDGRRVAELRLAAHIRCRDVQFPRRSQDFPLLGITLYDENRKSLGHFWIGPLQGSFDWRPFQKKIRVPVAAREGLLRIGLFGATGEIAFDDVRLNPKSR